MSAEGIDQKAPCGCPKSDRCIRDECVKCCYCGQSIIKPEPAPERVLHQPDAEWVIHQPKPGPEFRLWLEGDETFIRLLPDHITIKFSELAELVREVAERRKLRP